MTTTDTAQRPHRPHLGQTSGTEWATTLDRYHRTAAGVLDTHVNNGGQCAACGQSWPCSRTLAAAFALEL